MIVLSDYLSLTDLDRFGPSDSVTGCSTWDDVLRELKTEYPSHADVAVFPYASIQCPA